MSTQDPKSPEQLWSMLDSLESQAAQQLSQLAGDFLPTIRTCCGCGIQAPTLPGQQSLTVDLRTAALFLKRTLNDLRATWSLLMRGYTSQGASVAASLWEHGMSVVCIVGDEARAKQALAGSAHELPWKPKELAKIYADKEGKQSRQEGKAFTRRDWQETWQHVYAHYQWLCKIKHPTLTSTRHDAGSAVARSGEFVVMPFPDVRPEDYPMKATVLTVACSRSYSAIKHFVASLTSNRSSPEFQLFDKKLSSIPSTLGSVYQKYCPPDRSLPLVLATPSSGASRPIN